MRSKRSIWWESVSKGHVNSRHDSSSESRGRLILQLSPFLGSVFLFGIG